MKCLTFTMVLTAGTIIGLTVIIVLIAVTLSRTTVKTIASAVKMKPTGDTINGLTVSLTGLTDPVVLLTDKMAVSPSKTRLTGVTFPVSGLKVSPSVVTSAYEWDNSGDEAGNNFE